MRIDPWFAVTLLAALNLLAFFAQGFDKWRAKHGTTRTRERTLLLFGLPLAACGMWLGMRVFHHKTSKVSFLLGAWIVTALNVALIWGLFEAMHRGWFAIGGVAPG